MLELNQVTVIFNENTPNERIALNHVDLRLEEGDFVTIIGSNGAGKSTLLNSIAGSIQIHSGNIKLANQELTRMKEHRRSRMIGRLFQDPLKGTAPTMTIEENLGLAYSRGKRRSLNFGVRRQDEEAFKALLTPLQLGLEDRLRSPAGQLSGGQRQALTLLMATIVTPKLLLLDEHTAALDPKTAEQIMKMTDEIVKKNNITTIMITHNIENALRYGNKTIVMNDGKIMRILQKEERAKLKVADIMEMYANEHAVLSDRTLL